MKYMKVLGSKIVLKSLLLAAAFGSALSIAQGADNLVANGGFEAGLNPGTSTELSSGSTALEGWSIVNGNLDYIGTRWVAAGGGRCIDLSGTVAGTISQTIRGLSPGHRYRFSFQMAVNPEAPPSTTELLVSVGDTSDRFTVTGVGTTSDLRWQSLFVDFDASAVDVELSLTSLNSGWAGPVLDELSLVALDDPASRVFSISSGFSTAENPAGSWRHGWMRELGGELTTLSFGKPFSADNGVPLFCWQLSNTEGPAVCKVLGPGIARSANGQFVAPPGTVYLSPGLNGATQNFAVARFTLPVGAGGQYEIQTSVADVFDGSFQGDTDFHILKNGTELFGQFLAPHSTDGYTNVLTLAEGDTIDFVVGRGEDGNQTGSLLKVFARLVSVPLPPTDAPTIRSQPASVAATVGQAVVFSVNVVGASPFAYQWYFGELPLDSGTNRTLSLPHVGFGDAGGYHVVVSNAFGSVTSLVAMLTVNAPSPETNIVIINASFEDPPIADGQYNVNSMPGWVGTSIFHVANPSDNWFVGTASGSGASSPIHGLNIGGINTGTTLNQDLSARVEPYTRYTLRLLVGRRFGVPFGNSTVSLMAGNLVLAEAGPAAPEEGHFSPLEITYDSPDSGSILGQNLRIQLKCSGGDAQLWFDNLRLTKSSLTPPPPAPPTIRTAPLSAVAVLGQSVDFSVDVVGTAPFSYQWYRGEVAVAEGTNRTLSLANVGFGDAGGYQVVVTNSYGAVTSSVATLTVGYPAARVQVVSVDTLALGPVQVPVQLVANGNENAVAFSLNYDAARLAFVSAELGAGAAGGTLLVNDSSLANGRVGLSVALPAGLTFASGTQAVVSVTFTAGGVPSVQRLPIQFGDEPVVRQLSDATAETLAAVYTAGSISVSPTAVRAGAVETVTGGLASLPVSLRALGTENAVSFSLGYNTSLLAFSGVQAGADLPPDASILVNTSQAAAGQVGISVALPAGATFPRGLSAILQANFDVATVLQPVTTQIRFGDNPTVRQVANVNAQSIPATYGTGSVSVVSVALEADIAPRSTGDQALTVIDWVQAGRFAAALDVVEPGEFQRVDCAPREGRGNGVISVADWVQAGRYSAGLDPVTGIGGPSEPVLALAGVGGGGGGGNSDCVVRISNTNVLPGSTVNVPVQVAASGTENALGFSLVYDASKLRFVGATKLGAIGAATLNINTNQASAGRVGVAFALPTGNVLTAGNQDVLLVTLAAATAVSGSTTVSFGDSPVVREAVSATARTVSSSFTPGEIVLGPPLVVGPPMSIVRSSESVVIFWSAAEAGYELQASDAPRGETWSTVTASPIEIGGQKIVTLPRTGSQKYFRLRKP